MKYPDSLQKLIDRSKKRRMCLRQYKFEALKEIIYLAMDKKTDNNVDKMVIAL